ncbi:MAG: hypothetical protein JWP88_63 [Flaviaesturariibacter sp.]|nr:hypothetical protein [Flaviaesturariibacter sp.]
MNPLPVKVSALLLQHTAEIAFLVDLDGNITDYNKAFASFLDHSSTSLKASIIDFTCSSEKHLALKFTRKATSGIPAYGHLAFRTGTGEQRIGKITLVPFFEDGVIAGATGFIQDVTQTVNSNKETFDQEQRLNAIFHHQPDSVAVLSVEGLIIDLNPTGFELLGATKETLGQENFLHFIHPEDREAVSNTLEQVCNGESATLQFRMAREEAICWVETHTAPLKDKYGKIYATLSVIRDITDKKEIEEQLRKQQERLENTRKIARIGYWEYDFIKKKGRATDGLYEIYGLHRSSHPEVTFDLFLSIVHPDDRERLSTHISNLLEKKLVEEEHRIIHPDGRIIYVHHSGNTTYDENGNALYVSGAVQDITERRESERQLQLSEQRFKSLVQNGSDLIVLMDEHGILKYVSPSAKAIAGYEPEDLLNKSAFQFIHPDDHALVLEELQSVIGSENSGQATPHRFLNAAGEWMWLESKGVNLMHDANIQGIIINARDITDRVKLKAQLDKELASRQKDITSAVIKAQESERSQLGQELHDNVNQVLTTIKLYNEMLLDGIGDSQDLLQKSVKHLQNCINEIRSISKRLSAPTLGKISLSDSIHELVDSINLTKKIYIHCNIRESAKACITQEVHLTIYRIIQEQLNNILKHAEASNAYIELVSTPKEFTLLIQDDGKGFNVNMKRTGIGITNIITRAENINGRVTIESKSGKGTTLKFCFPPVSSPL